jgi:hypothetical protein
MTQCGKIQYCQRGHTSQYGACALYTVYLGLYTHSEYVTLIAFPLQKLLHERASMLRYR